MYGERGRKNFQLQRGENSRIHVILDRVFQEEKCKLWAAVRLKDILELQI